MHAIVLAAGYARRLSPLTDNCPKALLPVRGVPLLDYVMSKVFAVPGIDGVTLVSNHRYIAHFENWLRWRRPGGTVVPMRVVGDEAEKAVAELLAGMGFDLVDQSRASRGAFDLLATRGPAQLGVQVKRATLPWRCPRAEWSRMAAEGRRFHWHWIVAAVGEREEIALLDPAKAVLRKEATLRENARIANLPLWLDTREVLPVTREAVRRRD